MDQQLHNHYLHTMGIQSWLEKAAAIETPAQEIEGASWESLQQQAAACQRCSLSTSRSHVVFGVGSQQADLLIVGEAPGYHEDKQGEPFVGEAGQLLDNMLLAIGLTRQQVYIANVLKCRPPENREPQPEEVAQCTPFLQQQIELLQPKLIIALGKHAAHYLLQTTQSFEQLRKAVHTFGEKQLPVIVSYHPAYLLRQPSDKAKSFIDWQGVAGYL